MKKLLFVFAILFIAVSSNAQSQKPSTEQKQTINPIIDEGFIEWGKRWSYDRYVSRSAKITSIKVNEDYGDIEVDGEFDYKRILTVFSGTFTAKINREGKLVSITYTDHAGVRGSKSF
jgi:hypothetical protein